MKQLVFEEQQRSTTADSFTFIHQLQESTAPTLSPLDQFYSRLPRVVNCPIKHRTLVMLAQIIFSQRYHSRNQATALQFDESIYLSWYATNIYHGKELAPQLTLKTVHAQPLQILMKTKTLVKIWGAGEVGRPLFYQHTSRH